MAFKHSGSKKVCVCKMLLKMCTIKIWAKGYFNDPLMKFTRKDVRHCFSIEASVIVTKDNFVSEFKYFMLL